MLPALPQPDDGRHDMGKVLHWEAERPLSWNCRCGSLLLHSLIFLLWSPVRHTAAAPPLPPRVAYFQPAPGEAPVRKVMPLVAVPDNLAAPPPHGSGGKEVRVDLGTIQLSFADDTRSEFPQVVQAQHGLLALLDREDRSLARYLLEAPDWQAREVVLDVSRYFAVLMSPPEKWRVFRDSARQNGIDLNRYQTAALFEAPFQICLKRAILARANADPKRSGAVTSARLAIAAAQPCGIEVLDVSFAGQ